MFHILFPSFKRIVYNKYFCVIIDSIRLVMCFFLFLIKNNTKCNYDNYKQFHDYHKKKDLFVY